MRSGRAGTIGLMIKSTKPGMPKRVFGEPGEVQLPQGPPVAMPLVYDGIADPAYSHGIWHCQDPVLKLVAVSGDSLDPLLISTCILWLGVMPRRAARKKKFGGGMAVGGRHVRPVGAPTENNKQRLN